MQINNYYGKYDVAQEQISQSRLKNIIEPSNQKIDKSINETAEDFVSVFMFSMLSQMYDSNKVDPLFGGGRGEQIFKSLWLEEASKLMAKNDQLDLSEEVRKEILRLQEV